MKEFPCSLILSAGPTSKFKDRVKNLFSYVNAVLYKKKSDEKEARNFHAVVSLLIEPIAFLTFTSVIAVGLLFKVPNIKTAYCSKYPPFK